PGDDLISFVDRVAGLNLADPRRIDDLLDIAVDNVSFDDRLGMGDLRDLAARFGSVGGDAMGLHTLPTEAFTTSGGAAVLRLLDEQARPVLDLFRDEPAPPTAGGDSAGDVPDLDAIPDVVVDVRNGTGAAGQAAALAADLEAVGFMSGTLGDAPDAPLAATRVAYHPDDLLAADRLARQLVTGAVLLADPAISPGRLVVTSGADFAGVSETPASVNPQGPPPTTTTSAPTTTRAPVTTTTVIGRSIGAVPPGETCG
ncbi:MAG: LytR C-terminal domain-containing protein, partial [Acidimicrobiales bacterium]